MTFDNLVKLTAMGLEKELRVLIVTSDEKNAADFIARLQEMFPDLSTHGEVDILTLTEGNMSAWGPGNPDPEEQYLETTDDPLGIENGTFEDDLDEEEDWEEEDLDEDEDWDEDDDLDFEETLDDFDDEEDE